MEQHVANKRAFYAQITPDRTHRAAFREFMISNFPCLETRVQVHTAVSLMPGDPDGIYSELQDWKVEISLEDAVEISRLYQAAYAEGESARKEQVARKAQLV